MVRSGDYKGQQAAALKLHRTFKQNKYLFWAIMSLALQENALSYTLAERMMTKAQEEGRLEEVEHLRLFLLVLLDQKKHSQALALLDESELGKTSLRDPEVRQIKVELLQENKKWAEVQIATEQALRKENSDDWISWLAYFDAVEALMEQDKAVLDKARTLVADLKKLALEAPVLKRGPFLAELELDYRLSKSSTGNNAGTRGNRADAETQWIRVLFWNISYPILRVLAPSHAVARMFKPTLPSYAPIRNKPKTSLHLCKTPSATPKRR